MSKQGSTTFPLYRHPSRHRRPAGLLWFSVLCCGLLLSIHHHAFVRAHFAANPLPLNAANALLVNGIGASDGSGSSVSGVGDMNSDGLDDFVVGAVRATNSVSNTGQVYLLFGRNASTPWPNPFELSSLDGTNGVTLNGVEASGFIGGTVAGLKDVNGDNINDLVIGSLTGPTAYLVFGIDGAWPAVVDLTQGEFNGVTIKGQSNDRTGSSVASAGDVNNDGMDDVAIGVRFATTSGGLYGGRMDVLYGRPMGSPWPAVVNLPSYVTPTTGFSVIGENGGDRCGQAVSSLGDVNGDSVDDVAVGCDFADPLGVDDAGIVAVVFGSSAALQSVTPSQLNGDNGFVVNGQGVLDNVAYALTPVGDVNADGLDDFAMGVPFADADGSENSGDVHVLFGRNASVTPWPAQVNVSSLDGNIGFTLAGLRYYQFGHSVCAAGDVNVDGIDDFVVGALGAGDSTAFLFYGRTVWPARQTTNQVGTSHSVTFERPGEGGGFCGWSVALIGDVNGDGRGDLAISCPRAGIAGRSQAGQTAVVFGPLFTRAPTTAAPTYTPTTVSPTTAAPTTSTTSTTTSSPTTEFPTAATSTASPTAPSDNNKSSGLSGGAIAGITLVVLVVTALIVLVTVKLVMRASNQSHGSNVQMGTM